MTTHIDPFMLSTNLHINPSGSLVDQLRGKTFSVDGRGTDASHKASITSITNHNSTYDPGSQVIADSSHISTSEYVSVAESDAHKDNVQLLAHTATASNYSITLVDGTVLTQDDFKDGTPSERSILIHILADGQVLIDVTDKMMPVLNKYPAIAKISFPEDLKLDTHWDGYYIDQVNSEYSPLCLCSNTQVMTSHGNCRAGDLGISDLVQTRDHGWQPVRWIAKNKLSAHDLHDNPDIQPIRIKAGSLNVNIPARDLIVSPQHRILLCSNLIGRITADTEILVAAKHLLDLPGIEIANDVDSITYVHILFDRHEIICANGAWTESLYTGMEAWKTLTPAQRKEILAIFSDAETWPDRPARVFASRKQAQKIIERSTKHDHPLMTVAPDGSATRQTKAHEEMNL